MKLISFQIFHSFGFINSEKIELDNPNNFIYVLGRNSSGKSSLLNAIKYLSKGIKPSEQLNFQNFSVNDSSSYFRAEFSLEDKIISVEKFKNDFNALLKSKYVDSAAISQSPDIKRMVEQTQLLYEEAIDELNNEKNCAVYKFATGNYYFAKSSDTESYKPRQNKINELIKKSTNNQGQFISGGAWRTLEVNFNAFENLIFNQFPQIYLFNEQFSLKESLPNKINEDWNSEGSNFEKRFIEYLGSDKIDRILATNDPKERRELEGFLNDRVKQLIERVNESRSAGEKQDLLEILLDMSPEGIQITVYTDGKPSFYSHLSDNTKFLFAYHLYQNTVNISGNILLFDEPNNGFHPTAQKQLLRFLQKLANSGNLVIVSTHSEHLVDTNRTFA